MQTAERERLGFEILGECYLAWLPDHGAYSYTLESTLDMSHRPADTTAVFDEHGRRSAFHGQTGVHARTTFDSWIIALHFGSWREGGLLHRALAEASPVAPE